VAKHKTGLLHITVNERSLSKLRNDAPEDIINDYYSSQSVITVTPGGLHQMASQLAGRHLFCAGSRRKKRHQPAGAVTYLPEQPEHLLLTPNLYKAHLHVFLILIS